jgi:6-phosphogluconolactonase
LPSSSRHHLLICACAATLLVTACGSGSNSTPATGNNTAPTQDTPAQDAPKGNNGQPAKPPGRFLYVGNPNQQTVSAYAIDPATGALTEISGSPFPSRGPGPGRSTLTVSPGGKFLYSSNATNKGIFSIDPTSGALSEITGSPVANFSGSTSSFTIDAAGKFGYDFDGNDVTVWAIDSTSGGLTDVIGYNPARGGEPNPLFPAGVDATSFVVDPSGRYSYATRSGMFGGPATIAGFVIDPAHKNPANQLVPIIPGSPWATGPEPFAMTIDPTGTLAYVTSCYSNTITGYTIDPATGNLTALASAPLAAPGCPEYAAIHPSSQFVYVSNETGASVGAYAVDPQTHALTAVPGSPFAVGLRPTAVVLDPSGKFLYVANAASASISAFSVDEVSGVLTPVPGSPFAVADNDYFMAIAP